MNMELEKNEQSSAKTENTKLNLSPAQTFVFGIVGGILVLCTVGFFILLSLFLKGPSLNDNSNNLAVNENEVENVVANDGSNGGIPGGLNGLAEEIGLNVDKFQSCLAQKKFASKIESDSKDAEQTGLEGTPYTILIGPKGENVVINGAQPFSVVDASIAQFVDGKATDSALKPVSGLKFAPINTKTEYLRGNKNAKISMIVYSDLECPYCKNYHETLLQAMEKYGDKIKVVMRHFPLSFHPKAPTEALAVECAGEQGKFWEMTDLIFKVTPSNNGLNL